MTPRPPARRRTYALAGLAATAALSLTAALTPATLASHAPNSPEALAAQAALLDGPVGATGYRVLTGRFEETATITIYEDFACPACAELETYAGPNLDRLALDRVIRVEHQPVAILDDASTTRYSTRAANAYAAVLHVSGERAASRFRTLLLTNQPTSPDGHTDQDLIGYAAGAGADIDLVTPLIRDLTFADWVAASTRDAHADGYTGTPTVLIDEEPVPDPMDGTLPDLLQQAVDRYDS